MCAKRKTGALLVPLHRATIFLQGALPLFHISTTPVSVITLQRQHAFGQHVSPHVPQPSVLFVASI